MGKSQETYGELFVEDCPVDQTQADAGVIAVPSIIWRPGKRLQGKLSPGFEIRLKMLDKAHEGRFLYPELDYTERGIQQFTSYLTAARSAGFAILCKKQKLNKQRRFLHNSLWLYFLRAHRTPEAIHRRFATTKDLTAKIDGRTVSILPWTQGADPDDLQCDPDLPRNVNEFLPYARAEATSDGIDSPTTVQSISYGLKRAAKELPFKISSRKEIKRLLFESLFICDDDAVIDKKSYDDVDLKIVQTLWSHIDSDQEWPDLKSWYMGSSSSFIKQVAQKLKAFDLPDATRLVRRVIVSQGFKAYGNIGRCIQLAMDDVAALMSPPFTDGELRRHRLFYHCQPFLDETPIILLADKLQFLAGGLHELQVAPGHVAEVTFQTLLQFYGRMARIRRSLDLEKSRKRRAPLKPLIEDATSSDLKGRRSKADRAERSASKSHSLEAIFAALHDNAGWTCDCESPNHIDSWDAISDRTWDSKRTCGCCGETFGPRTWDNEEIADLFGNDREGD